MGNLFFINETLELSTVSISDRDQRFINFCKAMNLVKLEKDNLYATEDIFTIQFSYGNVFSDLFYKSWSEININPNLQGISNTAHSLFQSLFFAVPNMISIVNSYEEFFNLYEKFNIGYTGIEQNQNDYIPFVCCANTWLEWKCEWLSNNQNLIKWDDVEDLFLPNKKESDELLRQEIIKHGKESALIDKYENNIGQAFHDEVMRHKGSQIGAYTIEIGGKIAKINFYKYEVELSKKEQSECHSLRNIFSIISKDGSLQYISLDHAHGMFEFHNHTGAHQGEYKFNGSFNSEAEDDHSFRTL
ncbi:hypothetical protein IR010_11590 [Flavobacterium sp. MR2016-29]|uniref:hypothetical protein n=1 Tax=Flavobacterium sp. MR2016-29 TaxID=2783795 RepID=UPI00188D24A0|nr:hypothetical protein [Flavobacterium sp. MR2016-29]MBF4493186.1 hypothetical protein [Flavobacterium sp. MR2016-29]